MKKARTFTNNATKNVYNVEEFSVEIDHSLAADIILYGVRVCKNLEINLL